MTTVRPRITPPSGTSGGPRYGTPIDFAAKTFARAVVRMNALDPVLTELVRLRCARTHDCRLCQSLQYRPALEAGLDDATLGAADDYEHSDLDLRTKAALRLTDAMLSVPVTIDAELRAELTVLFSARQLAELVLDIMKWSQQKILVALRLDEPRPDGLTGLNYDADGNTIIDAVPTA